MIQNELLNFYSQCTTFFSSLSLPLSSGELTTLLQPSNPISSSSFFSFHPFFLSFLSLLERNEKRRRGGKKREVVLCYLSFRHSQFKVNSGARVECWCNLCSTTREKEREKDKAKFFKKKPNEPKVRRMRKRRKRKKLKSLSEDGLTTHLTQIF